MTSHDVVVVGAGPAGLATSRELGRASIDHAVLERGAEIGHTWANLYDGLVLHTGKHFSALPGMAFPAATPLFPTRRDFLEYLRRYADTFRLPVETGTEVTRIERVTDGWTVHSTAGAPARARLIVIATGIVSNPHVPDFPDSGRYGGGIIHSAFYRRPDPFKGQRVLVVGAGNSAAEISVELAEAGVDVSVAVRTGAPAVPREMFGIPIQYFAVALGPLPAPVRRLVSQATAGISARLRGSPVLPRNATGSNPICSNIPLIGFDFVDAIRAGSIQLRGAVRRFTSSGVTFSDGSEARFDRVILATGYRSAVRMLGDQIRIDACGFAVRRDRVASADQPDLYFVGHNYDTQGGLRNIARDATRTARLIAKAPS